MDRFVLIYARTLEELTKILNNADVCSVIHVERKLLGGYCAIVDISPQLVEVTNMDEDYEVDVKCSSRYLNVESA